MADRSCLAPMIAASYGGVEENAGSYLIMELSHPVAAFDGHLDSHRRKKDRKNEHRDQVDLERGQ